MDASARLRPIFCPRDVNVCEQLDRNLIGERIFFQNGRALIDVMNLYQSNQPYSAYANWNPGYCFHSDWFLGYFINFYNISEYKGVAPLEKIQEYKESSRGFPRSLSYNYTGGQLPKGITAKKHVTGNCLCDMKKQSSMVDTGSDICHYMTGEDMYRAAKTL